MTPAPSVEQWLDANGTVKDNLPANTVDQLEAKHLWSNMDAKIASLGGCDQIPN